jgi:single-stranded DNA-binding protein
MIAALVAGTLFREPESRTSKAGRPFAAATIKEGRGDDLRWVNVLAFSEATQTELGRLRPGDAVTVQGALTASTYVRDGDHRVSLTVIADAVLPLRAAPKERKSSAAAPDSPTREERLAGSWQSPTDGPNDSIPF